MYIRMLYVYRTIVCCYVPGNIRVITIRRLKGLEIEYIFHTDGMVSASWRIRKSAECQLHRQVAQNRS